jgi:WD40 repeat protein
VESVAFSPDRQLPASGSADNTIRLWQVADGKLLQTLEGHTGAVPSIAFSPGGKLLISGSSDGTIRLWGVAPSAWARRSPETHHHPYEEDAAAQRRASFGRALGRGKFALGQYNGLKI